MHRDEHLDDGSLIDLGSITMLTRGVAPNPLVDTQGTMSVGGLDD